MRKIKKLRQVFHPRVRFGLVGLHESPRAVVKFELERDGKLCRIKMCVLAMDERYRCSEEAVAKASVCLHSENGGSVYSALCPELRLCGNFLHVYLRGSDKEADLYLARLPDRQTLPDARALVKRCLKLLAGWELAENEKVVQAASAAIDIEIESLPPTEPSPPKEPMTMARLAELAGRCCKLAEEGLLNENNVRQAIRHEALLEELLRSSARHLANAARLGELLKKFDAPPEQRTEEDV